MKHVLFLIIGSLLLFGGCTLERSNPMDVGIEPPIVSHFTLTHSSEFAETPWVDIEIDALDDDTVDGYYIYRSGSLNGNYLLENRIVFSDEDSLIYRHRDELNLVSGAYYYYKLSTFIEINGGRLEGQKTAAKAIRIPE